MIQKKTVMKLKSYIRRYKNTLFTLLAVFIVLLCYANPEAVIKIISHPIFKYITYFVFCIVGIFFIFIDRKH